MSKPNASLPRPMREVRLYLLAGLRTAPLFMEGFRVALHGRLEASGRSVRSRLLFPYGDWSRAVVPQLWEIRRDIGAGARRPERSIGGRRVLDLLLGEGREQGTRTLLVGHSAGGLAGLQAAQRLQALEGGEPSPVVMIGSPRCRIPEAMLPYVLYMYAAGAEAPSGGSFRPADRVSRLGSFGGWTARPRRLPSWTADKFAPAHSRALPIVGGHADYFRERPPFVGPSGRSNLELTLETAWSWLETVL
ncbi:hypothetical protein [Cohnella massiliensis]|uniref:hypothetical protein n=1 Tax=Cohnella massiliensis TaxID=1816691 RepID=UPI0009BC0285|nr:hypothetical protein [Cohnella massiliensis]